MSDPIYCRHCDYNPCMCGKHEYMTQAEARIVAEQENKRWENDPWIKREIDD